MSKTRNLSDLLDANGDVKSTALDNVPASDVVNDTTPSLGGNLDSNGYSISLPDSTGSLVNRLRFGNSADLTIYHDGSNSYIDDNGTGDFIIRAGDIAIKSITDENHIVCLRNGSTSLYYDNSKKLETTSGGATVTGTLSATAFSGDGSALTGVGGGITMVNQWRVNATFTNSGTNDITSNWEQVDSDGYGKIGSDMTESSGIFTFPTTGIYYIIFKTQGRADGAARTSVGGRISTTTNGSTYSAASLSANDATGNLYNFNTFTDHIFDVTDTSTHKVKFQASSNGSAFYDNESALSYTTVLFLRLGDT